MLNKGLPVLLLIACAIFIGLQSSAAVAGSYDDRVWRGMPGVTIEPLQKMRGKKMPWDHEIQIALPLSYGTAQKAYPVLWVMDGSHTFETAVLITNMYARGVYPPNHIPEMIVVGVGVPRKVIGEYVERRSFDFSHSASLSFDDYGSEFIDKLIETSPFLSNSKNRIGAPKFLSFLVDELRPKLAKKYRMSDDNTIWGFSGGGVFCTYALLARPESFQRYICGSPAMYSGNKELLRMEREYAKSHKDLPAKVHFNVGEYEAVEGGIISGFGVVSSTARMVEILTMRQYPSLELHFEVFKGEDHLSAMPPSLSWGLRALWSAEATINQTEN